jgi:vacuolar-type H+-ATPase subunit H
MTNASLISEINKVLHEERESRARIEACRHEAEKIVENGRYHARRISDRADERIGIVQARTDLCVDAQLAELKQQIAALSDGSVTIDQADPQLLVAIEALINQLVGEVE